MFGEESFKAEQERKARQSQYADDLRKQMKEKETSRNKAFQDSASKHILNLNSNTYENPNTNLNQNIRRNSSWAPSQYLGITDTNDTSNKAFNVISNKNFSDNPPLSSRPSFNVKQIAEEQIRASAITNETKPTYSNNNNNYGNNNNNNHSNEFNLKIQSQIQGLKSSIDRIISIEIPMRMKSNDEAISSLKTQIENAMQLSRDSSQTFRDKIAELSYNYNQVNQKTLDHSEKLRSSVSDLKNDFTQKNDAFNSRFISIETRLDTLESSIRTISNKQQEIIRILSQQSSSLSSAITSVEKKADLGDQNIITQLENLNKETISTFSQVNKAIESATTGLNESLNSLAKDVRESFKIVRSETDNELSQMRAQNDNSMMEIGKSFSTLQNEFVSTISTFRSIMNDSIESLQDAFATEVKSRNEADQMLSSNQKEIVSKFTDQCNFLQTNIDKVQSSIQPAVSQLCNSYFSKWRNELSAFVNGTLSSIEGLKAKTSENEQKFTEFASLQSKTNNDVFKRLSIESKAKEEMNQEISTIKSQAEEFDAKYQQQLKEVNDDIASRCDYLKNKHKKNKVKILQALDRTELESRLDAIEKEITGRLKEKLESLETQAETTQAATVTINERLDTTVDGLTKLRETVPNDLTARLAQIVTIASNQSKLKGKVAKTVSNFNERFNKVETTVNEKANEIETNFNDKVAKLETNVNEKTNELKTNVNDKVTQLEATVNEKANEVETNVNDKFTKLETNVNEKTNEIETNVNNRVTQLETAINEKTKEIETNANERANTFETSVNQRVSQLEATVNTKTQEIETSINGKVLQLETALSRKATEIETTMNGKATEIETTLNRRAMEIETTLNGRANEIETNVNERIAKIEMTINDFDHSSTQANKNRVSVQSRNVIIPPDNDNNSNNSQLNSTKKSMSDQNTSKIQNFDLHLCLDLDHNDISPDNPKPGPFTLFITQPKQTDAKGLILQKPKKICCCICKPLEAPVDRDIKETPRRTKKPKAPSSQPSSNQRARRRKVSKP